LGGEVISTNVERPERTTSLGGWGPLGGRGVEVRGGEGRE